MAYGVDELARLVAQDATELPLVVQRVRQWATMRLLPLEEGQRPGKGRARKFSGEAVVNARILNVLAENGIFAGGRAIGPEFFDEIFDTAKQALMEAAADREAFYADLRRPRQADKDGRIHLPEYAVYFLIIYRGRSLRSPSTLKSPGVWVVRSSRVALSADQEHPPEPLVPGGWTLFPQGAVSAVVINLTALTDPRLSIS